MEMLVSLVKASIMGAQEPLASKGIWIYSVLLFITIFENNDTCQIYLFIWTLLFV